MSSLPKKDDDGNATLSHTQMNKFNMCPKAYEYRYVEGIKGTMPGRVKVGSAFDKAANFINEERMLNKKADPEPAMHRATEYMDDPGEDFDETDIAADEGLMSRLDEAVREYASLMADVEVIATQHAVSRNILYDVIIEGFIDTVELIPSNNVVKDVMITDNKTTLKKRSGKYTYDTATIDPQLNLYAWLYQQDAITAVGKGWRVVDIGRKTPGRIEEVQVIDNNPDGTASLTEQALLATVTQMEAACDTGLFAPLGRGTWLCSHAYCEFYNRCPYGSKSQTTIPVGYF